MKPEPYWMIKVFYSWPKDKKKPVDHNGNPTTIVVGFTGGQTWSLMNGIKVCRWLSMYQVSVIEDTYGQALIPPNTTIYGWEPGNMTTHHDSEERWYPGWAKDKIAIIDKMRGE